MRYRLVFFDMVSRSFMGISRWGAQFEGEASGRAARKPVRTRLGVTKVVVPSENGFSALSPPMAAVRVDSCEGSCTPFRENFLRAPEFS
jgi:hypothetical protein